MMDKVNDYKEAKDWLKNTDAILIVDCQII